MHQEFRPYALAIRVKREQLHPARIDADQRLAGRRGQAGDGPVIALCRARDRDAVEAVAPENLQGLLRLRHAPQLVEAREIFETQLRRFRALGHVARVRLALQLLLLLLEAEEPAKASLVLAATGAHS